MKNRSTHVTAMLIGLALLMSAGLAQAQLLRAKPPQDASGRIGIVVSTNAGPFTIEKIIANMPASQAGLLPGDTIVEIGGKSTTGMTPEEFSRLAHGEVESRVKLVIVNSEGKKRKITLERSYRSLEAYEADEQAYFDAFKPKALAWRQLAAKPVLPEETIKRRILAENAVKEGRLMEAKDYYRAGLMVAEYLWPEGHFNTAILCGELGNQRLGRPSLPNSVPDGLAADPLQAAVDYRDAVNFMRYYLELRPNTPDLQTAREKIIIWEERVRILKEQYGASIRVR